MMGYQSEPMVATTQAYHLGEWAKRSNGHYLLEFLAPLEIANNATVLDIGCGSGYVNAYLASRRTLKHNLGVDFDLDTLRLARQLTAGTSTISWVCASAEAIPLPDAFVDHLVCRAVLPYVPVDPVLCQIGRLLRPNGTAVFLVVSWRYHLGWLSLKPSQWKQSLSGLLFFLLGLWFNVTGQQIFIRLGRRRIGQTFNTESRLRKLLRQQGLTVYKIVRKPEFLVYARKSGQGTTSEGHAGVPE